MRRSIDFKSIGEFLSNKVEFERAGIPIDMIPTTGLPYDPSYWLNPEKGELGALSENFLYSPAEAKKLTAAAGYSQPIPIFVPFDGSGGGALSESNQLQMDSFKASGAFAPNVELVTSREKHNEWRISRTFSGIVPSSTSNDPDYFLYRDMGSKYHNQPEGPFHEKTDAFIDAERRAIVFEERTKILKDIQVWLAEWMPIIPTTHQYTSFSFRWPWLRNFNWGDGGTEGYLAWGAHKQWLDPDMPNRNG
jgi:ABC-type transport system substrate-binding protein